MFRLAALLLLALAGSAPVFAATPEALTIDLRGATPHINKLAHYPAGNPIGVRVDAPHAASATLLGVAPDGTNLRVPLARESDGAFMGSLVPATLGTWSLAATTASGGSTVTTESFALDVYAPQSNLGAIVMAALSLASIAGGVGLIAVKRNADLTQAA